MPRPPASAAAFASAVILLAGITLAAGLPAATFAQPWPFASLLLVSSIASAFRLGAVGTRDSSGVAITNGVELFAVAMLSPGEATLVAMAGAFSQCAFASRRPQWLHDTIFHIAKATLTVQAAIAGYVLLGGVPGQPVRDFLPMAQPLVAAAFLYFVVDGLLGLGHRLAARARNGEGWSQVAAASGRSTIVGAAGAIMATYAIGASGFWLVPFTATILYVSYRMHGVYLARIENERQQAQALSELHLSTLEALALAIDAKDRPGHNHIRRVQIFATHLARAFDLPLRDQQAIRTAALLHDIGKLAVPEHILAKPGPLTPEEARKMNLHPQIGAEIIGGVPFPYPVAPLILSHHEHWDGSGYPAGLRGEEIPLGARILALANMFDERRSSAPGSGFDVALSWLQEAAGRELDPGVVHRFLQLAPQMRTAAQKSDLEAPRIRMSGEDADARPRPSVFEDIALAHQEIYALYQIAQTMGTSLGVADTMGLIASKLSSVVPFSACALFLHQENGNTLVCRFATGVDSELIQQLALRIGSGLTGWVAAHRTPLLNARPVADLEAAGSPLGTDLESALVCPLVFDDRLIGTVGVYHTSPAFYHEDHQRLLERVCEQAAAVIHNAVVFEQTQEDSLTDPLTGLPNTRFMTAHLERELSRSERLGTEISLIVLDLDAFKRINDTFGHHVGDRALRAVADVLRDAIRPYDICVRYAGDEFVVVLAGCGAEEAEQKRLELKSAVNNVLFEPEPGNPWPLSLSAGVAVFPHDARTYESLIASADVRMYRDKHLRREADTDAEDAPGDEDMADLSSTPVRKPH